MITHYPKDWIARCSSHYAHAVEKHPRFCDALLPKEASKQIVGKWLTECRKSLRDNIRAKRINALDLLECEIAEATAEIVNGNSNRAVDEIYDAIAILLRMADMIERNGFAVAAPSATR